MGYQAIYRRFRPKQFDDVLGQEHVTATLKNQILNDNIAHAYLFSGTRGTGKTSTAKIFARAVNCLNNKDGNPCNQCEICKGILDDTIMDVVEMDAASNNSVDDIRELREKVKYPPSKGRYKVYIIDEVHMLSKGAFNALLKTLEEPPKHLLFILATTEPQKIPATILSRCQRFDFKRLSTDYIVRNMRNICDQIGISIEDKSLRLIARNSDGAMRDALSILDQCISFTDGSIDYEYVLSILGTVNNDLVFDICDSIINGDLNRALKHIDEIVQRGKDINQFIKDLIMHFRNLMIAKTANDLHNLIDTSDEAIERFKQQAEKVELEDIIRYLNILSEAEVQSKRSSQPRVVLEVNMIKLLTPSTDMTLEGLLKRVKDIERIIKEGRIDLKKENKKDEESKSSDKPVKSDITTKKTIEKEHKQKEKKAEVPDTTPSKDFGSNVDFNTILNNWSDILKKIKTDRISIHALLMEGRPVGLEGNTINVSFEEGFAFHKEAIDKKENREYIEGVIEEYFGIKVKLRFLMDDEVEKKENSNEEKDLIEKVKSIFGEDIVEVE